MPERRAISGKAFVSTIAVVALAGVLFLVADSINGKLMCGEVPVIVSFGPELSTHIKEVRYWPFGSLTSDPNPDELPGVTEQAKSATLGFECRLPYSFEERGLIYHRRIETAPIPNHFTIWLLLDDGSWIQRQVITPTPVPNGERLVTIADSP